MEKHGRYEVTFAVNVLSLYALNYWTGLQLPSVRSVFHIIPAVIMRDTLEVDSSVHLMQHDSICLVKKCKIHFRIL